MRIQVPLLLCVFTSLFAAGQQAQTTVAPDKAAAWGRLPLSFQPNAGQTAPQVKFLAQGPGYSVFLTPGAATLSLRHTDSAETGQPRIAAARSSRRAALRMDLVGASASSVFEGEDRLPGTANYMRSSDRAGAHTGLPTFGQVAEKSVYPGVDLVYYGSNGRLEYDFIVAPDADPSRIRLRFAGAQPKLSAGGNLVLALGKDSVSFERPEMYQDGPRGRERVDGSFTLAANGDAAFRLGSYDRSRPLVIDPVVLYGSYLGGGTSGFSTSISSIALNAAGDIYVTGETDTPDFPTTTGVVEPTCPAAPAGDTGTICQANSRDNAAFVSKIAANGQSLIYSTYLGGDYTSAGTSIAVNSNDDSWITGNTTSPNFPITSHAVQTICNPEANGNAPGSTIITACPGNPSGFVVELSAAGTEELYGTFLGGTAGAYPQGIAVDTSGDVYVAGSTQSWTPADNTYPTGGSLFNFPITSNAFQSAGITGGGEDGFLTEFSSNGASLLYSTFIGLNQNTDPDVCAAGADCQTFINAVAAGNGQVTIAGNTYSRNYPTTSGALITTCPAQNNGGNPTGACLLQSGVLASFNTAKSGAGSLVFSTYLYGTLPTEGGMATGSDAATAVKADASGNIFVGGYTQDSNFPTTKGAFQTTCITSNGVCADSFLMKFTPAGALTWSTIFGSSRADDGNNQISAIALDASENVAFTLAQNIGIGLPTVEALTVGGSNNGNAGNTAYLGMMSSTGTSLRFGSYFGTTSGACCLAPTGIAVDSSENVILAGTTPGANLPLINPLFSDNQGGYDDGFFTKIALLPQPSTTKFAASSYSYYSGQTTAINLSVAVAAGLQTPTGTVSFSAAGMSLGSASLPASGTVTVDVSTAAYAPGAYTLTGTYSGDGAYAASSASTKVTILARNATQTTLSATPDPATTGSPVTLTATVKATSGSIVPTGSVTFSASGETIGTANLSAGVAKVTASTSGVPAGQYTVTATYSGATTFASSTGSTTETLK